MMFNSFFNEIYILTAAAFGDLVNYLILLFYPYGFPDFPASMPRSTNVSLCYLFVLHE